MDYSTYLRLPELLALASPKSVPENPDERHFIVTHQAIELNLQVIVADLRRARDLTDADALAEASAVMRRACALVDVCLAQMSALVHLPVDSFHAFRPFLGTASGLQSVQFREVEVLSGLRYEGYRRRMRGIFGGRIPPSLNRALSERSLADAHRAAGARRDVTRWTGFVGGPGHEPEFDSLTQILMEFDDAWIRWRNGHLTVVMRMLGTNAVGTAGCDSAYLLERVHQRFFQHLWEGRGQVAQGR